MSTPKERLENLIQTKSEEVRKAKETKFSKEDHEFVDFLFGKLTSLTDTEMIDLQDDDSCDDHLQFEQRLLNEQSWRCGYDYLTEGALGDYPAE